MRLSAVAFGLVLIPFTLLAKPYASVTKKITTSEMMTIAVAALGPSGLAEGKLVDIGGDCAFAIVKNGQTNTVDFQLIQGTKDLEAKFSPDKTLNYTREALSDEGAKDGNYVEVFQSEDGKVEARISLTKSAAMSNSVSTAHTKLTCGNL